MYTLDELRESGERHGREQARRLEKANIPARFLGLEWDDLDPTPDTDVVRAWVDLVVSGQTLGNPRSQWFAKGLLLHGNPGTGKTTLAMVALQAILKQSTLATWGPQWTSKLQPVSPAYADYYRNVIGVVQRQMSGRTSEAEDLRLDRILCDGDDDFGYRLVLLDDVGKEHRGGSGWAASWFEGLLRRRYYAGYPTIVTTNVTPSQWEGVYGESCASFMHEAFAMVPIQTETDRRKLEAAI